MNNQNTFASTAVPEAGTPTTPSTATADGAGSSMVTRIDVFIERSFKKAESADFSGIMDSATAAARHGFVNSANSRYAQFLEGFRDSPELAARYREEWPNSFFLPWRAFHAVRRSLSLWCDLPSSFTGAVPGEQVPWLDIFEMNTDYGVKSGDIPKLFGGLRKLELCMLLGFTARWGMGHHDEGSAGWDFVQRHYGREFTLGAMLGSVRQILLQDNQHLLNLVLKEFVLPLFDGFFVLAPKDAFNTEKDWFGRAADMERALKATEKRTAPDDPLVIRFVEGGAMVVAAWGEEAAWLNKAARDLNL
jgi:hypothetical protein